MDFVNFALHEYFKTLNHHTNWTSPFIWNSNCPCHVQKIFHPNLYMLSTLMYLYSLPLHITLEYKFVSNSVDVPTTTYRIRLMYYVLWKVIVQTVSCDDFWPRTHAHSHTQFSAARTSHARVHFAIIWIAHAHARLCLWVCVLSKFAPAHAPL